MATTLWSQHIPAYPALTGTEWVKDGPDLDTAFTNKYKPDSAHLCHGLVISQTSWRSSDMCCILHTDHMHSTVRRKLPSRSNLIIFDLSLEFNPSYYVLSL